MANISAIKLPNGTTYSIKDSSGEKSSHTHDSTSFVPIESKTYTGIIAASNDDANCYKYCIKVVPDSYGGQWDIKYRLIATIDNVSDENGNGKQESLVYISGMRATYAAYQTWNNITNTSYRPIYYHTFRPATEAGISYGHLIGLSLRYAYNPTTSTNKRNITIELLSYHGCTVTFFDSMLIYANVPGTGSTNYNNLVNFDATTQGNTMTGDRNDVNYYNRTNYSSRTTAAALYRYQFCLTKRDGTLVPVNSVNNSIATNKTLTTDTFNPFGEIFYWNSTTTYSANANVGNGSFYRQYLCDLRYSFNCGGYDAAGILTARQPLYLVCALQSDGMAKLHSSPLSMTLPSSDDGLIYIYLGRTYEDTYPYRVVLTFNHPIYYYKNGRIRELVDTAMSAESASSVAWSGVTSKPTTISGYGITDAKIESGVITLGSNTITPLTSLSTLNAAKLSGAIPSAVTATTQTAGDNSTKIATTAFVSSAISGLPTPMQFIGTVGTNGTTTWANLPTASGHNGYTYKVITAHTAETGKPAADVGDALISNGTEWIVIPAGDETATQNATTGISIANHGTGTVIGVQSSTTTASKVTVGSHSTDYGVTSAGSASTWTFEEKTIPNVTSAGSASSWTFEEKTIPNVTAAGSGSASLTFAMDTTDTKKLKITFSHTHTAPTIGTAIKVQSKSGGSNGTAPTLGTAIKVQSKSGGANSTAPTLGSKVPTVSASDVTVPIKNASASTFVTGTTHTITDNGHTHTI